MKKCPPGEYYCTKDKRCKSIPKGWHVMRSGYLMRDEDHKKKNGNGNGKNGNGHSNGNGNGSNGNGNGGNGGGVSEAVRLHPKTGNIISVNLAWRGNDYNLKMFFPYVKTPSRREVQDQVRKVYPNAKLWNYKVSDYDPGEPVLQVGGK